ncbi:hypothetical protein ACJMK2_010954 [Sinanodonta woodiana]|uniref:Uncharacterized protein n=1 Tax=Sinanodonta woodiana TaxID=1069815 RepID=A0ABD3V578_SINWO
MILQSLVLLLFYVCKSWGQLDSMNVGCALQAVPSNDKLYRVYIPIRGYLTFHCPPNTRFNNHTCVCDWMDNPELPSPTTPNPFGSGGSFTDGMTGRTTQPPKPTTKPPCNLRPARDRHYYEEYIYGFDWQERQCPIGTLYNHDRCACHDIDTVLEAMCRPELWLNFDEKIIKDEAGSSIPIGNNGNVISASNAGRFDGTGTLTIWRYANVDMGTTLSINLRFYDFPGGVSDEQVLVSNCYGRRLGSVEIAINTFDKEVIFRADTSMSGPQEIRIPYQEKTWKNVTFVYDGKTLSGKVDEQTQSMPMKGNLGTRFNGFLLGSCNGRGFVGYLDDVRLYRCMPTRNAGAISSPAGLGMENTLTNGGLV